MAAAILCAQVKHEIANGQHSSLVGAGRLPELLVSVDRDLCAELRLLGHLDDVAGLRNDRYFVHILTVYTWNSRHSLQFIDVFPTLMFHVTFVTYTHTPEFHTGIRPVFGGRAAGIRIPGNL